MNLPALELKGVVKRYARRTALDRLDLSVPAGTLFGLVGSNGAGKTTALSIIAGITRPDSGSVCVLGNGKFDPAIHAGRVSLMPQDSLLPMEARAGELLAFYARLQGMNSSEAAKSTNDVLEWVHLTDRAASTIQSLSHGMRRRVMIAQAFLGDPELVLLDEPLSGLDPREVVNIRRLLMLRKNRQTVILSSHNLHEIQLTCDAVAFIEKGKKIRQDTMETITGKTGVVTYLLQGRKPDTGGLSQLLPGTQFQLEPSEEDGLVTLRCEYNGATMTPSELNSVVLRYLLEHEAGVVTVTLGSGLERAYLAGT